MLHPPYGSPGGFGPLSSAPGSSNGGDMPTIAELHALLGAGTSFRGKISFAGRVRIDGSFEGEILGGELLVIGEGADVRGQVRVDSVIVQGGRVDADIVAPRSIELYVPAQVSGSLHSPQIFLDKGVVFSGQLDMSPVE
jgi:cytoskeletal protein CcmA (bactofilin family)